MFSIDQIIVELPPLKRGCHLITKHIVQAMPLISSYRVGLLHLFLQHTSAALTINENADPDVRHDLEQAMSRIVSEDFPYQHDAEGPDDMPAHVRSSLIGVSLTIPVRDGALALGTWQGIYLWEHRDDVHQRRVVATIQGSKKQ